MRKVRVLVNPGSGLLRSFSAMRRVFDKHWDVSGTDLAYQFSQSSADSADKARRAVDEGVDTVIVMGGDGTVSTIGRVLMGTDVKLGVIPTGSGNGFARHFSIPLSPEKAIAAIANSKIEQVDVGMVNSLPFLVTCSFAWDASLVESFEKMPVRGILPYVFAGVQEYFQYEPQPIEIQIDDKEMIKLPNPIMLTVANLSEYGGGAKIAPDAHHDDGLLELVMVKKEDATKLLANIVSLFNGSINKLQEVETRSFSEMTVKRGHAAKIQIDGELVDAGEEIKVEIVPKALKVLVPN